MKKWHLAILVGLIPSPLLAAPPPESTAARQEAAKLDALPPLKAPAKIRIDHSGRKEKGIASYYAKSFSDRKMADGRRMNPNADIAASKSLPLGSVAKVTNLENGKTATVKIEDRGPFARNRVIDLAPKVAAQLDLKHQGIAPVVVKPITLPQKDGEVKLGAGAAEASPKEIRNAVAETKAMTRQGHTPEETAER
jgi:rare lipoprotein A